jgi:hypothetical protein
MHTAQKGGEQAVRSAAIMLGTEWATESFNRPVSYQPNKLDTAGAASEEGVRD